MADERTVRGLSELQTFLDQLAPKIEANIMRGALRAGMNVVKPVAQSNIHSVSGELAAGLKISTRKRGRTVVASLKTKGEHPSNLGIWLEYGTKAHFISVQEAERGVNRRTGKTLSMTTVNRNVLRIGQTFVGPTVHHPGARKRPFMRPALDQQATVAVVAAGNYIKDRLATREGLDTSHVTIEGDE